MKPSNFWGVLLLFALPGAPQEAPAPQTPAQRIVIDGSKEPHRIPDLVAWRMLFKALAGGPNRFPEEVRRRYLDGSELSELQIDRVMLAARRVSLRVREMELEVKKQPLSMEEKTATLRARRDAIIQDVVRDLLIQELSTEATQKLLDYLNQEVKSAIRIARPSGGSPAR